MRESALQCQIATHPAELDALEGDWLRLWEQAPRREVFTTFAWARTSLEVPGTTLCTPVVRRDGEVVAILPLAREGDLVRFLGSPDSDYNDVLCRNDAGAEALETALRALLDETTGWTRCELQNIWDDSRIFAHIDEVASSVRARLHLAFRSRCPRTVFPDGDDSVLRKILKKKSLRRHRNKMARKGKLEFRHLESREEIHEHLPTFFAQHESRRRLAGDRSIFEDEARRTFFKSLVDRLDPRAQLRFAVVELDGRPVAYHLGFEQDGVFVWYKPAFDAKMATDSPGEVLLLNLFEYVGQRGLSVFDFTVGEEAFKDRFATESMRCYTLHCFPRGLRGWSSRSWFRARDMVKGNPRLYRALKRLAGSG